MAGSNIHNQARRESRAMIDGKSPAPKPKHKHKPVAATPAGAAHARKHIPVRTETKAQMIARLKRLADEAQEALAAAEASQGRGQRTVYKPEFAIRVTDMCLLGLTNEELANRFGVDPSVVDTWLRTIPEFRQAAWDGREGADQKVARAMYLAANGYAHPEDDIRTVSLGGNAGSEIVITPTTKHYAPNDRAAQVWLRNRQRARWPAIGADGAAGGEGGDATPQDRAQAVRDAIKAAMAETAPQQLSQGQEAS
jgi:hypothetical protein